MMNSSIEFGHSAQYWRPEDIRCEDTPEAKYCQARKGEFVFVSDSAV